MDYIVTCIPIPIAPCLVVLMILDNTLKRELQEANEAPPTKVAKNMSPLERSKALHDS